MKTLLTLLAGLTLAAGCSKKRDVDLTDVTPVKSNGQEEKEGFDQTHAGFTRILEHHVEDGDVDYSGIKKDHKADLDAYVKSLEAVQKEDYAGWTKNEQLAFWMNAYNAYTIKKVVDNMPIRNFRKDLGGTLSSVFDEAFIPLTNLFGEKASLNNIEHDVIREKFEEPRIHFALVCASISCPPLRAEAFRGKDLEAQLEDQAKVFLNDTTKNRYDKAKNTLFLSKIFDWYGDDFNGVKKYVRKYLEFPDDATVGHLKYDWNLNGK